MQKTFTDYGDDENGEPIVPVYVRGDVIIVETGAYTVPGYPPCTEFYVFRGDTLARVCPSIGMAREVAAGL